MVNNKVASSGSVSSVDSSRKGSSHVLPSLGIKGSTTKDDKLKQSWRAAKQQRPPDLKPAKRERETNKPTARKGKDALSQVGEKLQRTSLDVEEPLDTATTSNSELAGGDTKAKRKTKQIVNTALTPAAALKIFINQMSLYEQGEILDYPQVYFVGPRAEKINGGAGHAHNHGYDDERGDYKWVPHDQIGYQYESLEVLGKGSFGQVLRVVDHKTNRLVAIKIIRNKKRFHHQALVEVKLLDHLRKKEGSHNIIQMLDYFYFRDHLCIVFELMSINLYEFIKNNNFHGFSLSLIRRFSVQMLNALKVLRKDGIIHCDLKPENVLLKHPTKSSIKVIDFGSSCYENERIYTYIQSRFYRSPEVILGYSYGTQIDMWSLGCILAELYTGYPIFPGENESEQLQCIMEIIDVPPLSMIERSSRKTSFFDANGGPKLLSNSRGKVRRPNTKPLYGVLRCKDHLFVEFLEKCFVWDPKDRLTPEEALEHAWIVNEFQERRPGQQIGAVEGSRKKPPPIPAKQTRSKLPALR